MAIALLIQIAIFGLIVWLINRFIPMDPVIRQIFTVVAAIILILWLASSFGVLQPLPYRIR